MPAEASPATPPAGGEGATEEKRFVLAPGTDATDTEGRGNGVDDDDEVYDLDAAKAAKEANGGGGERGDSPVAGSLQQQQQEAKTVTHAVSRDDKEYRVVVDLLEKGSGADVPRQEAKVTVLLYADESAEAPAERVSGELGMWEHAVLDSALMKLKAGAKARITVVDKRAMSEVAHVVRMEAFENPPFPYNLSIEEKIEYVAARRAAGNEFFRAKDFARAARKYEAAMVYADDRFGLGLQEQADLKAAAAPVLNNLAAIHVMNKEYREAIAKLGTVLAVQPDNVKALLRRARSYGGVHEYGSAEKDLAAVEALAPGKDVLDEVAAVRVQLAVGQAASHKTEKKTYAKMFQ